ncbi:50S ribosomal protein L31 type B [Pseudomonas syringae pv. japonica str. M301072]|uniref:Large ribosomal subunit protein bL31B n=1 Tax=Pseudomonas syringae pv. japonica str. M301072 TaxID=629262 RepID=F3FID0_PSESX|nr:50S ribosomal protein L31 type B [Pseudomonas syringae pv. japonica str. M301072]
MKPDIHPQYRTVLFHDTAADAYFLIGSTVDTDRTQQHTDGTTYPYVALDVSSASHPMYTGQQRKTTTEGRIAGFNKRFAAFGSAGKKRNRSRSMSGLTSRSWAFHMDCPRPGFFCLNFRPAANHLLD